MQHHGLQPDLDISCFYKYNHQKKYLRIGAVWKRHHDKAL